MKGAMNVDFEKFYGHLVLKKNANWMLVGLPHMYVRKGTTYVTKRSRKRHTFSNMILGVIEFCCDALFSISHLNGQEKNEIWNAIRCYSQNRRERGVL